MNRKEDKLAKSSQRFMAVNSKGHEISCNTLQENRYLMKYENIVLKGGQRGPKGNSSGARGQL